LNTHSLVESTLSSFSRALSKALVSERVSVKRGLLQALDPRTRVLGTLFLVFAAVLCRRVEILAGLFGIAIVLAFGSRVGLGTLIKRVWLIIFGFTGLIALPALFTTPGQPLVRLPGVHGFISVQGLRTAALLVLRVETAATLTTILVLSTPWSHILKALRSLHLPAEVVTMLAMTHRYVFLLMETANQMFESRQSRAVGKLKGAELRRMVASTAGVLLSKSIEVSHEVYLAMLSRGFQGEIRLLDDFRMSARDYAALAAFLVIGCVAVGLGR